MTSSNMNYDVTMSGNVDLAFVDRADIKQYIGCPGPPAIYMILSSCLKELCRVGIVNGKCDVTIESVTSPCKV